MAGDAADDAVGAERRDVHRLAHVRRRRETQRGVVGRRTAFDHGANRAERGAGFRPQVADLARRKHGRPRRRTAFGRLSQRLGLALQPGHDGIDLGARFAQPLVQLVVETLLEDRLALGEPRFALVQRVTRLLERLARAGDMQLFLLDRGQLLVDSGQVCREERFAAVRRARASATIAAGMPSRSAISRARLRPGAP